MKYIGAGQIVRDYRKRAGISLRNLAHKTGIEPGTLSKYENNLLSMSDEVSAVISIALGMQPDTIAIAHLRCKYPSKIKAVTF